VSANRSDEPFVRRTQSLSLIERAYDSNLTRLCVFTQAHKQLGKNNDMRLERTDKGTILVGPPRDLVVGWGLFAALTADGPKLVSGDTLPTSKCQQ